MENDEGSSEQLGANLLQVSTEFGFKDEIFK